MTNSENIRPIETTESPSVSGEYRVPAWYSALKIAEYLLLAAAIASFWLTFSVPQNQKLLISFAGFITSFIFVFLLEKQAWSDIKMKLNQAELLTKSKIQSSMLETAEDSTSTIIFVARTRALKYCQDLITDYQKTRRNSRNIYYMSQISTIILSGITPILVVVERLDSGPVWFKWLPVIFPAVAAIVSSIVTSFPFQENWIEANKIVELLEAEQEKFVLGISPAYRCYDIAETTKRQTKAKQSIENFITQVNNIHLKQIQQPSSEKADVETASANSEINSTQIA
ncbi:MAG: DUF4231 domain-containing protein [Cyanobacteriota bacterium]|nr:DUF4231 domain-containing protein [Cyanobacteriota bacterium]